MLVSSLISFLTRGCKNLRTLAKNICPFQQQTPGKWTLWDHIIRREVSFEQASLKSFIALLMTSKMLKYTNLVCWT